MDSERIKKLPKWAQAEIKHLQYKVECLEEELRNLEGEAPDDGVYIGSGRKKYPLPDSEYIWKKLENGELEFDFSKKDSIKIYGIYRSRRALVVLPVCSNVVEIKIIEEK